MIAAVLDGKLARAEPGARGNCPECKSKVYARMPDHAIRHWAHAPLIGDETRDCSRDAGEMSEWHRAWQFERTDLECIEVAGEGHRADVVNADGYVVEFQRSSITPEDVESRERYWRKGCWVLDGTPREDRGMELPTERIKVTKRPEQAADDPYCSFRWDRAHLLLYRAKWPVWIDLGGRLIQVREARQARGTGWLVDRQWFVDNVINGTRVALRPHVVRNTEATRKLAEKRVGQARPERDEDLTKFDPHCTRAAEAIQTTTPALRPATQIHRPVPRQIVQPVRRAVQPALSIAGPVLDWSSSRISDPQPCRICGRQALMRDPDGSPCHKVCAERKGNGA